MNSCVRVEKAELLRPLWYAVHTRANHERKVGEELLRQTFEAFNPEYQTWSVRKDRRKKILKPLFPGYLFVRTALDGARRISILQTKSVVRLVGIGYRPIPVADHEVDSIRLLLQSATDAACCPILRGGQLVQVVSGALSGVVGVVLQAQKRRIVVSVDLLGRAVSASLDTDAVIPYHPS